MKITNIIILLFVLAAFAVGSGYHNNTNLTPTNISILIDNQNLSSNVRDNFNFASENTDSNMMKTLFNIMGSYADFIITILQEVFDYGVSFGYENPEYFQIEFVYFIIKVIVGLIILSLIIKPLFYLIIFIILGFLWIRDKYNQRKNKRLKNEKKK